jgi:hypothetical protein
MDNGLTYDIPSSTNLMFGAAAEAPSTRLVLDAREKSFKAEIVLRGAIKRDMSSKHNPQARKWYTWEIAVSAKNIYHV